MTDPEKGLFQQLREVFARQDRAPLIAGLVAIPVVIVIAVLVAGGGDDSESIPSSEAFGDSASAPGSTVQEESATGTVTPTETAETAPADTTTSPGASTETTTSVTTPEAPAPTGEIATGEPSDEGDDGDDKEFATIQSVDSSWVKGQGSLYSFDGYLAVIGRADQVGSAYQSARDAIEAEQLALAEQQIEQAKEAARRKALAAYRAALARAKRERERQERLLAERRQRIKEKLQALREKYKVDPGEECSIPEVQEAFDCSTGYPF